MASRSLDDLIESVKLKARVFVSCCADQGIDVLIYCTLRTNKEQDELYKIGRSLPGKIITNAKGGESWHNYGRAFDFVPMVAGKPQWGAKELYLQCGVIAEECGLEWAGRWSGKLKETAHCQYTEGLKLSDMKG
tara:strand:+ start:3700 stop:4101 length:402 start_codon:yes stop_codon:yes gene_type:complete